MVVLDVVKRINEVTDEYDYEYDYENELFIFSAIRNPRSAIRDPLPPP
jgi:hypothetical protein